jgi:low affinity Fe/Cu permease
MMAKANGSIAFSVVAILTIIVAIISGKSLSMHFSRNSLLSYGISFLLALLMIMYVFVYYSK